MLKKAHKPAKKATPKRKPPQPVKHKEPRMNATPREVEEEIIPPDDEEEEDDDPVADDPDEEPEDPEEEDAVATTLPHVSGHRDQPHLDVWEQRYTWEPGKPSDEQLAAMQEAEKTADGFKEAKEARIEQIAAERQGELDAAVGKKPEPKEE